MQAVNNTTYKSFVTIEYNEYIYNELKNMFPQSINVNKKELGVVLNMAPKTITNKMSDGSLNIKFIKTGKSMQSGVLFPIVAVAEYLTKQLCDTEYFGAA